MALAETVAAASEERSAPLGSTERQDRGWGGPLLTGLGLASFVVYSGLFTTETPRHGDFPDRAYFSAEITVI